MGDEGRVRRVEDIISNAYGEDLARIHDVGFGHFARDEETHRLRLYRPKEIAALLRRIGFRARIVRRHGESTFPPGLTGFVARKA